MSAIPAAGVGVSLAERGGQAAAKALTADIIVINGKHYREIRTREPTGKLTKGGRPQMRTVRRLEPISYDIHVNPVSVAVGAAVAALAGGFAMWWLGLGIKKTNPTVVLEGGTYDADGLRDLIAGHEAELADRKEGLLVLQDALKHCLEDCRGDSPWERKACTDECRRAYERDKAADEAEIARLTALLTSEKKALAGIQKGSFKLESRPRLGDKPLISWKP